jgi:hypothetical protein
MLKIFFIILYIFHIICEGSSVEEKNVLEKLSSSCSSSSSSSSSDSLEYILIIANKRRYYA